VLDDGSYADAVRADEEQASEAGIASVPFFVIDWTYGFSGARPAGLLTEALREAWRAGQAGASPASAEPPSASPASGGQSAPSHSQPR
jgi:predicted DsbA family dithiol-disulfide isomerase